MQTKNLVRQGRSSLEGVADKIPPIAPDVLIPLSKEVSTFDRHETVGPTVGPWFEANGASRFLLTKQRAQFATEKIA